MRIAAITYLMGRVKDLPRIRFHDPQHSHAMQRLAAGVHSKWHRNAWDTQRSAARSTSIAT